MQVPQQSFSLVVSKEGALQKIASAALLIPVLIASGCKRNSFPDVPPGYREFAYVSNGKSNTVSVLDLVYVRQDRTLQVGNQPTGVTANPKRNEVYVVNTESGSISVIDTNSNSVVATIPVHKFPYFIDVDTTGHRAYVANSGSNSVSIIDVDARREIAAVGTGEQPGLARVSPDGRTVVVTNRGSSSVSVLGVEPYVEPAAHVIPRLGSKRTQSTSAMPRLRAVFSGCPGATDAVILPDSSKAFIACSGGYQVMAISLAAAPDSWAAKQDPTLLTDHMLALLEVGDTPVHLGLKPDGGQIFCSNFKSDSVSTIDTQTNEVSRTDTIANQPVYSVVGADNSTLWISNFGADSVNLWSIDDGKLEPYSVRTGHAPDVLAFSADQHLLLAADAQSGDVSVIRTTDKNGPALFTILPAGQAPNAIAIKAMQGKK